MPSPAEAYLLDFHARLAGVTSRWFGSSPVQRNGETAASSYALLEAVVPAGGPLTVLDVACGDGHLLELLARRKQPGLSLLGLDMSEHELAAARARLNGAATLVHGRAQSLPFGDASVDVVLSHLALMLMDDVGTVLAEFRRVLKPGGQVSVVVGGGDLAPDNALTVFAGLMKSRQSTEPPLMLGDVRVRSEDGLRSLFAEGFTDVTVQSLSVQGDGSPQEVWESLITTYDADRLSPEARVSLQESFIQAVEPLRRADGSVPLRWGMRQLTATRA